MNEVLLTDAELELILACRSKFKKCDGCVFKLTWVVRNLIEIEDHKKDESELLCSVRCKDS